MRRSIIAVLAVVVVLSVGGFFYLNCRQQTETGYKDGLKMGYLCGFNDGRDEKPFNPDGTRTFVPLEDESAYTVGFMTGAVEGYRKGYAFGKEKSS
jgi:hypothetical protein